ncbi:hypothetical protein PGIGA_G00168950, partial [Pangasianodon gigas]|nr:hypothetical protein [Pangasianodon gigas]
MKCSDLLHMAEGWHDIQGEAQAQSDSHHGASRGTKFKAEPEGGVMSTTKLEGRSGIPVSWETQPNGSICVIIFSTVANRQGDGDSQSS